MINNRQGGRRRGRGGQRPQGMPGNTGNARDNRQRGNAAQLHEKYKNMARDSQLAGDRVQSEYYLQYADHYFRVLGESRSRYEEQRRQRGDEGGDEEEDFESAEAEGEEEQQPRREERSERRERPERAERAERSDEPRRGRANGRQRDRGDDDGERIAFDALPPAIAPGSSEAGQADDEDRPRRRTRRARPAEDESDTATAG